MRLLKDPILHFFLIGALIFATYLWINPDSLSDDTDIVVDAAQVKHLSARFERAWNRAPTDDELKALIDNFVVEEILYRQALAMGLDNNDSVIRRRLRQKMEFLTMEAINIEEPTTDELQQYLEANSEQFKTAARFSFEQVYINTDQLTENWKAQLQAIQDQLREGEQVTGAPSLIPVKFEQAPDYEIDRTFGANFSDRLAQLTLNQWSEPLQSGLGVHFVRLSSYQPATLPPLASVEKEVIREWRNARNQQMKNQLLDKLRTNYSIKIELENQSPVEGRS